MGWAPTDLSSVGRASDCSEFQSHQSVASSILAGPRFLIKGLEKQIFMKNRKK